MGSAGGVLTFARQVEHTAMTARPVSARENREGLEGTIVDMALFTPYTATDPWKTA